MSRPGRRWLLVGWLVPIYIAADWAYWHRRGGAFNPRPRK